MASDRREYEGGLHADSKGKMKLVSKNNSVLLPRRDISLDAMKGLLIIVLVVEHACSFAFFLGLGHFITAGYMQAFFFLAGMTAKVDCCLEDIVVKKGKKVINSLFGLQFHSGIVSLDIANVSRWLGVSFKL